MSPRPFIPTLACFLVLAGALGCSSGGGGTPTPPAAVTVSVNPPSATLVTGATQAFVATVANASNTGVTWTVAEAAGGSVSASGLFTAPATISGASATFHVVATSQADNTKSATATVTVLPPVSVSVNPGSIVLAPGGTQQFAATVANAENAAVTWTVREGASGGAVTASGLYTAPATIGGASATFHVVATSVADASKNATATVGISAIPVISAFTATPATISPGQSSTLAWTVANATSLSLNQGLGSVSGSSTSVNPLVSTIYTLTASNANGTVNQSTTVTVQTPAHNLSFLAGNLGGYGNLDGPGSAARLGQPYGVACDVSGNAWVVDSGNYTIRKIAPDGMVSTFAGSPGQPGSADGTGSSARFKTPYGIVLDGSGNLYISDSSNHTIRKITAAGAVTTLAGSPGQSGSVNGNGSNARFKYPRGLALDGAGNLFVADQQNHAIRKVTPSGEVSTFAGTLGQSGFAEGVEGVAKLNGPFGLAMDGSGNFYVADTSNNSIRKITSGGVTSTFAGTSTGGNVDGIGTTARFLQPRGIAIDPAGNVFVSEQVDTIRKVTPSAEVSTLAGAYLQEGATDGPGGSARFYYPEGLAWDAAAGRLLVADAYNHSIRTVTPGGLVGTLAGSPPLSGSQDGLGSAARFYIPIGIAADSTGQLFVAEMGNETIRKVAPDGTVTAFVGSARQSGDADGTGPAARFRYPMGVALDGAGNLLVCESYGARIRKVSPIGVVTTLAGAFPGGGSTDGPGTVARFNGPNGIAVDPAGNAYVSDRQNFTIRKITPAGVVSTLAGTAGQSGFSDGSGAAARFAEPTGIALDSAGNVLVADRGNHTLRRITPDGTVSTLAGSPGQAGSTDGTGSAARFNGPYALTLDPVSGNLLVGDSGNSTIRVVTPAGVVTTLAGQPGMQGILLGALPGVISSANGIARLPDGRFVFTAANGLILLNP